MGEIMSTAIVTILNKIFPDYVGSLSQQTLLAGWCLIFIGGASYLVIKLIRWLMK